MESKERLCFDSAMSQWERSLKRPDLDERARVAGALLAYQRMAFAIDLRLALPPEDGRGLHHE